MHDLQRHAGKKETVAGAELRGKAFLHSAKLAAIGEAYGECGLIDDDACVQAVLLNEAGMGYAPGPVLFSGQPLEPVIGAQGVPPAFDEVRT